MIRPDGKPHHPEDGWPADGFPLKVAMAHQVMVREYSKEYTLPWSKLILDHAVKDRKEDARLWSPVILTSMARQKASVSHVTAIVYDFDRGQSWDDVVMVLEAYGIRFWAYTTFQHTEEKHRFRVVLGVDEAIPAEVYPKVWAGFREMLGWDVDEACKDCSRLFYLPTRPTGGPDAWQAWKEDGIGMDWRSMVAVLDSQEHQRRPARETVDSVSLRRQMDLASRTEEINRSIYAKMLDGIHPDAAYQHWIAMGMIAKELGMESEWSAWCSRGQKYRPGEPERKLRSFRR
jgi:hypothetical protein